MLRRAAAASFVSMLSSVPETLVSVHKMTTKSLIRNPCTIYIVVIAYMYVSGSLSDTAEWLA